MNPRLVSLLKEPSTWRGIILLITGTLGLSISTEEVDVLINAGFILSGVIGAFIGDK
jgi:hypothetical protein